MNLPLFILLGVIILLASAMAGLTASYKKIAGKAVKWKNEADKAQVLAVELHAARAQLAEAERNFENTLNRQKQAGDDRLALELEELEEKYRRSEELLWKVSIRSDKMIQKQFKRSDELLLNILPYKVAQELKQDGQSPARLYESVTVIFTDFRGFTKIAERLSPTELVAELNHCFSRFDDIMSKFGIEKIKTIGDSYMAVAGLPEPSATHAADAVAAVMEILTFIEEYNALREAEGKDRFEIKIGLHTGHVIAGIVGKRKFAYDIWGDTVNIASRMESSGMTGRINISETTYEAVKHLYHCTCRGKVEAKNKGELLMYLVDGAV